MTPLIYFDRPLPRFIVRVRGLDVKLRPMTDAELERVRGGGSPLLWVDTPTCPMVVEEYPFEGLLHLDMATRTGFRAEVQTEAARVAELALAQPTAGEQALMLDYIARVQLAMGLFFWLFDLLEAGP